MNESVLWHSPSAAFSFQVFSMSDSVKWNPVGGVYIFASQSISSYFPLYIGKADSFANRFSCHERWDDAVRAGATHVLASVVQHDTTRDEVEQAMIGQFQPKLNTHHREIRSGLLQAGIAGGLGAVFGALGAPKHTPSRGLLGLAALANVQPQRAPLSPALFGFGSARKSNLFGLADL
ncbi:MAG: GIY-YIG nuclease family protein [Stagnimonas sp.]|nr:GIY-YIG nuclease family protein [Stagnimonas sp.]